MTLYWWSHWFWITLGNLIFLHAVIVQSYPSQESTSQYNNNPRDNTKRIVTRLYQTSTVTWPTNVPASNASSTTAQSLKLEHVEQVSGKSTTDLPLKERIVSAQANSNDEEEYYYDYDATENVNEKLNNLEEMEAGSERKKTVSGETGGHQHEIDVKRSAEDVGNDTILDPRAEMKLWQTSTTTSLPEMSNYTNFTDGHNLASTNTTNAAILKGAISIANTTTTINTSTTLTSIANATTQMPQAPSTPKIVKAQTGNLDWSNTVAGQLPVSHVTTDLSQADNEQQHKVPFTLENVNKPEELRREESEHRTRKSKGLSAEYKVNHYINYSSDSKNLLTRSAATTVNEYDSGESNISSEALSVQRAYFTDVGAISAICLTVFGICCTVATVGIVLYRRRFLNKPQTLSEPDSSVYIDDSTMRVSDNSDEMYSLDNDSFLNSLEAMTIQNYWTDTVKHTKL